jgi:cyclohexadienyl dehydratase
MILAILRSRVRFASGPLAGLLLATLVGLANAQTPTRLDAILGAGVLRVGLTEDYRPFSFADASGKVEGIDVDMAKSLAQSLSVRLDVVKTSWPTLKSDLEANSFDIAMGGITITLDRQRTGLFSNPVFSSGKTPITHCGDEPKYGTIATIDRPGVRVIVNPGGTNERFDRAHLRKATIVPWSDNATIFDTLLDGKADLMITDPSKDGERRRQSFRSIRRKCKCSLSITTSIERPWREDSMRETSLPTSLNNCLAALRGADQ